MLRWMAEGNVVWLSPCKPPHALEMNVIKGNEVEQNLLKGKSQGISNFL